MSDEPTLRSSLTNAVVGAGAGVACAAILGAIYLKRDFLIPEARPYVIIALLAGAGTGGILGPLLRWGPLRHVSLARAVGWSVAGSLLGGVAFSMLGPNLTNPPALVILGGAIIGCLFAAELLRQRVRAV